MREFVVASPEAPLPAPPGLGRLGPFLVRFGAQQGAWPPLPPTHVARLFVDPARTATLAAPDAVEAGAARADTLVDGGTNLVVAGGGGSPTPALVLLAALLDRDPVAVTGTTAAPGWALLVAEVRDGLRAARPHLADPTALLAAAGAIEVAELTGLLLQCAVRRTPVLLSGALDVWAAALVAHRVAPGVRDWLLAGCSPQSKAAALAVGELRLAPLLDLELDQPAAAELALGVLVGAVELIAGPARA